MRINNAAHNDTNSNIIYVQAESRAILNNVLLTFASSLLYNTHNNVFIVCISADTCEIHSWTGFSIIECIKTISGRSRLETFRRKDITLKLLVESFIYRSGRSGHVTCLKVKYHATFRQFLLIKNPSSSYNEDTNIFYFFSTNSFYFLVYILD